MKTSRKLAAALAVFAAGSVFYGSLPAHAEGIELDGVKIVISRHHDDHMPPPEMHMPHHPEMHRPHHPEMHRPHGHRAHHPEMHRPHGHWPHHPPHRW